jgi:membrane protein YdbS with pleckstrin-like domain
MAEAFLTDGEDVRMSFRAHWKSGLMGMVLAVVLGGLGLWLGWWALDGFIWGGLLGLLIGAGVAIVASIGGITEWLTTRYWVTNERLIVRTGFLTKTGQEIPVDAINSVTVRQGPLERMLGYGDMTVESAAQGSLQVFRNVPDPVTVQKTIYDAREDRTMHLSGATGRSGGDAGSSRGRYDDLADLAKLRDDGVISDAEFEAEKAKLLGAGPDQPDPKPVDEA